MTDEFVFDGLNSSIRSILDDSFRRGKPSFDDAELARFISPISFDRDLTTNLVVFRKLVEAVMAKPEFKYERSKSDGWLAPRLHNALRLTRREAARKEFWIGLVFQNLDYLWWRFEVSRNNPVGLDRVLGSDSRMAFAQIWWAAELLVEADYNLSSTSARSSNLGMYFQTLDLFHSKPLAVALCKESFEKNHGRDYHINTTKKMNLSINCFVRDDIAASYSPDAKAVQKWILEKPKLDELLSDDLCVSLPVSTIDTAGLNKMEQFVEFVADQNSKN